MVIYSLLNDSWNVPDYVASNIRISKQQTGKIQEGSRSGLISGIIPAFA
jgi:hypothetical protein